MESKAPFETLAAELRGRLITPHSEDVVDKTSCLDRGVGIAQAPGLVETAREEGEASKRWIRLLPERDASRFRSTSSAG